MSFAGLDLDLAAPGRAAADLARARSTRAQWHGAARRRRSARRPAGVAVGQRPTRDAGAALVVSAAYALRDGLAWARPAAGRRGAALPRPVAGIFACAARMQRAAADLLRHARRRRATTARPWLDHGAWADGLPPLAAAAPTPPAPRPARCRPTTPSCASRATACTRSRSARCMPASSSRAISASRSSARRCCAWSSAWATRTRASSAASPSCAPLQAHRLAGRVSGDSTVAYAWAYCMALESACGCDGARARRAGCAR